MKTKKILFFIGILFLAILFFKPNTSFAITESEVVSKLNSIKNADGYRNGQYYKWNSAGYFSDYCYGQYYWHPAVNYSNMGWQCYAYGQDLFDQIFQQCSTCHANTNYDLKKLMPGDVVRLALGEHGHSIVVISSDGYSVEYTDANWNFDGIVRWNVWTNIDDLASIGILWVSHADNYYAGDTEKPILSNIHVHTPSIEKDKINVRVHASDNVGVTAVKFSSWQSGNSDTSGKTKWASYNTKDGCWETTFTKAEANIVGDNLGCIQAWAYDAAGNVSASDGVYDFVFGQRVDLESNFVARIVSKSYSNYCIGISGTNNGDDLKLKTKNQSDDSQLWSFIRNSDGTYRIINLKANKSFDTDGGTSAKDNGTIMQLWSYVEAVSQMQYIIQSYNGGYRIVPANQDKVRGVDLKDGKAQENQPIIVYQACSKDNKAQTWTLEKVATSISMNVSSTTIKKGETKKLSVKFNPTDVANKSIKWTTSNSAIATVSSSGLVKGVKEGIVTITATTTDGSNKKATCNVTITMPFKDVDTTYWGYDSIKYMYDRKYISGTNSTTFSPESKITRGMVVTILHNMEGQPYVSGKCKFSDVQNPNEWYYSAIKWASANNIVSGYSNGKFGPNDPVTREQLAVILNQYCKYKGKYKSVKADYSKFADSKKISSFAKWGMNWAVGSGIINGSKGNINPQGNATRAEAATMIYNYCTKIK